MFRRSGVVALLAIGCGGTSTSPGVVDAAGGPYPPLADAARDIVDTTLAVDVAARTATATITLAPSSSTGASFEIGDLMIGAVRAAGEPLLWTDTGDHLESDVGPDHPAHAARGDQQLDLEAAGRSDDGEVPYPAPRERPDQGHRVTRGDGAAEPDGGAVLHDGQRVVECGHGGAATGVRHAASPPPRVPRGHWHFRQ